MLAIYINRPGVLGISMFYTSFNMLHDKSGEFNGVNILKDGETGYTFLQYDKSNVDSKKSMKDLLASVSKTVEFRDMGTQGNVRTFMSEIQFDAFMKILCSKECFTAVDLEQTYMEAQWEWQNPLDGKKRKLRKTGAAAKQAKKVEEKKADYNFDDDPPF